jgi:hypothetical protein
MVPWGISIAVTISPPLIQMASVTLGGVVM